MINELIKLATHLDEKGLRKEADYLDVVIKQAQAEEPPPEPAPERARAKNLPLVEGDKPHKVTVHPPHKDLLMIKGELEKLGLTMKLKTLSDGWPELYHDSDIVNFKNTSAPYFVSNFSIGQRGFVG